MLSPIAIITVLLLTFYNLNSVNSAAIKYDQRQEGEVNVRADLENFVVLIIPTSSSSGLSLIDLITKALPTKKKNKRKPSKTSSIGENQTEDVNSTEELKHFIESKSVAPYHVDITHIRKNLAKLHPVKSETNEAMVEDVISKAAVNEAILISPTIKLSKEESLAERLKKAIIEDPDEIYVSETFEKNTIPLQQEINEDVEVGETQTETPTKKGVKSELVLIGAMEQCGPGRSRDELGICQFNAELNS